MKSNFNGTLVRWACVIIFTCFPVIGQGEVFSLISNIFQPKTPGMKEVASQIADLNDKNETWGLDFSPDGKYLAVTPLESPTVHIWNWQENRLEQTLERARGSNVQVSEPIRYSPDGKLLAICHDRPSSGIVIRIWNTDTWGVVHDIVESTGGGGCNAIGFTPDGKSLIRILRRSPEFPGNNLISYDTETWEVEWGMRTVPFYTTTLAISPDGKYVAIGGEILNPVSWPFSAPRPTYGYPPLPDMALMAIVDMEQQRIVRNVEVLRNCSVESPRLAWAPYGKRLAYIGRHGIDIFDAGAWTRTANEQFDNKGGSFLVRYTPDEKYFIEGGYWAGVAQVRIWDGMRHQLFQEIKTRPRAIAVSRDGRHLAVGGYRKIAIWRLK